MAWPRQVVSGGQTGVDQAALRVAAAAALPTGGWCPSGFLDEGGRIGSAEAWGLREVSADVWATRRDAFTALGLEFPGNDPWAPRTLLNIFDSSGTLVLHPGHAIADGTNLTIEAARALGRPLLIASVEDVTAAAEFAAWLQEHRVEVLNIAGPRESQSPGIGEAAEALLRAWLPM